MRWERRRQRGYSLFALLYLKLLNLKAPKARKPNRLPETEGKIPLAQS